MYRLILRVIALSLAIMTAMTSQAGHDEKFYSKACKKVWSMDLPEFDPKADLTDSIFQGASSVRIAVYNGITAKFENEFNAGKYISTGLSNTLATESSHIYRVMVKLNDARAVEYYTDFEIDAKDKESVYGYTFAKTNSAFGARIHKPDGTVVDVNTADALTVTEGKKDRAVLHKIAIPGLETGDVLEYFYYDEAYLDEVNLPSFTINLLGKSPTKSYTLDCNISPELTLEYACYNGAPMLMMLDENPGETNHVGFTVCDLPSVDTDMPFFSPRRQMPYVRLMVLNNFSRFLYHPKTARLGGVHSPTMGQILADAGHSIADASLADAPLGKALKLARQWQKDHPDATEHQLVDAAWMALYYVLTTDEDTYSDRAATVYFVDMLKKLKIKAPARHALATSRNMAPLSQLVSYKEPYYATLIGDSLYMPPTFTAMVPGQVDALISGEEIAVFEQDRGKPDFCISTATRVLPVARAGRNTSRTVINASLNPEDSQLLDMSCRLTFKNASKKGASLIIQPDIQIRAYEDYLGIPENKRQKITVDTEERAELDNAISKAVARYTVDTEFRSVDSLKIFSPGCTPDSPDLEIGFAGTAEGLVSRAGNNLMVSLGSLAGNQIELTENQRTRDIDAINAYPSNERTEIFFRIPDGYEPSAASLEALNIELSNGAGQFMSRARINPDDPSVVRLTVLFSMPLAIYRADEWNDVVEVLDTATRFAGSALLLTPSHP